MCPKPKTPEIKDPKKDAIEIFKNPYDDESNSRYKLRGIKGLTIQRNKSSSGLNTTNKNG